MFSKIRLQQRHQKASIWGKGLNCFYMQMNFYVSVRDNLWKHCSKLKSISWWAISPFVIRFSTHLNKCTFIYRDFHYIISGELTNFWLDLSIIVCCRLVVKPFDKHQISTRWFWKHLDKNIRNLQMKARILNRVKNIMTK